MCGIFALFNHETIDTYKSQDWFNAFISKAFNSASHRGPDNSTLMYDTVSRSYTGFHRLTINGSKQYYSSNQPICKKDIVLLCNGEIYNYHTLLQELDLTPLEKASHSGSDCEIIIDLYLKYGIDTTLELLDGVFAFILMDMRCLNELGEKDPKLYVARDPFGLRPLYWLKHNSFFENGDFIELIGSCLPFGFASEMKQLAPLFQHMKENKEYDDIGNCMSVDVFPPGHYCCYTGSLMNNKQNYLQKDAKTFDKQIIWSVKPSSIRIVKYFTFPHFRDLNHINHTNPVEKIATYLENAVDKRIHNTERPIACLLSGGIDSSLICGIIRKLLPKDKPLETYSIGMVGASDKEYIERVSKYINSTHTHVESSKEDFLNAIPDVIRLLETYDVTTIRASVGNYLIANYISKNSDAKVIFNGDGSDELFGGYKYFLNCPNKYEFNKERKRLLTDIHYFDVLRSERSISVNGLESRTPFLDKELVSYVMTLTQDLTYTYKNRTDSGLSEYKACVFEAMKVTGIEKWMLRRAFINSSLIPKSILCRSKEAFSDGVSNEDDSWYIIIQKYITSLLATHVVDIDGDLFIDRGTFLNTDETGIMIAMNDLLENNLYSKIQKYHRVDHDYTSKEINMLFIEAEKWYYKKIYNIYYHDIDSVPYYWMPKYSSETDDPSARTLNIYGKSNLKEDDYEEKQYKKIMLQDIEAYNLNANASFC